MGIVSLAQKSNTTNEWYKVIGTGVIEDLLAEDRDRFSKRVFEAGFSGQCYYEDGWPGCNFIDTMAGIWSWGTVWGRMNCLRSGRG